MCKITARIHQAAALQLHPPFPFKLDKKGCIIILLNSVCLDNTCRYKTHMMKQRIHARDHCGTLHPNAGRPSLHKNRALRFHTAKGKIKLQYTQRGGILSSIYWFTSGFSVSFFRLALPSSDTKDVVGQDRWREWFVNGQGTVRFYSTRFSPRSVLFLGESWLFGHQGGEDAPWNCEVLTPKRGALRPCSCDRRPEWCCGCCGCEPAEGGDDSPQRSPFPPDSASSPLPFLRFLCLLLLLLSDGDAGEKYQHQCRDREGGGCEGRGGRSLF